MIVTESDVLVAALDRRLAVDRVLALDPLAAIDSEAGARNTDGPATESVSARPVAGPASAPVTLVPGSIVAARVVDVPASDHVLVDIGRMRVALEWLAANGPTPTIGHDLALRVVARAPTLMFETLVDPAPAKAGNDPPPRLSADAMRLQQASSPTGGPIRFSAPIITMDAAPAPLVVAASATGTAIALHETAAAEKTFNDVPTPTTLPLVLQGPAWPGQDVELVVRRERADEAFDNAALDHWCGEIVIELPQMGRVTGHLAWSLQGLRLRLEGEDDDRARSLAGGAETLAAALADAGLPVVGLTVSRPMSSNSAGAGRG